jgi:hypothetical protein
MFRWLALVLVLATAPAVFVTLAQQPAPTARRDAIIRVRGASVGAFAAQGDLFAVGVGQQLQFYDLSEPASPRDLATVRLPGRALALGAVDSMMLVAVSRAANADEIVVVAPDPYRRSTPGIVNSLLTSEAIQEIAVAPSGAWAVALNADGYQVLRLTAPDVIESSALIRTADPPLAAAVTGCHFN